MRAALPESLRVSDVLRLYAKPGKGFGRKIVVVGKEIRAESVRIWYRGVTGGKETRRISDNVEGFTDLNRRIVHTIEGVWEGDTEPGQLGRIVLYNNRRYYSPPEESSNGERKGAIMPPKGKTARGGRKPAAAKKSTSNGGGGTRATEAQLDKLSAQVVKMRDTQGKAWSDICDTLDIQPSRARQLYNRGGGAPAERTAAKKPAAKRGGAKGKGKRSPS